MEGGVPGGSLAGSEDPSLSTGSASPPSSSRTGDASSPDSVLLLARSPTKISISVGGLSYGWSSVAVIMNIL